MASEASHSVVDLFAREHERLHDLSEGVAHVEHSPDLETAYIRREFGPLADDLVGVGHFTLEPDDLRAIWGSVLAVFPNRHLRYRFAAMLSGAFAIQEATDPLWETVPRALHEDPKNGFPDALRADTEGLTIVRQQLKVVSHNVGAVHSAERSELANELYENFGNGLGAFTIRMEQATGEW